MEIKIECGCGSKFKFDVEPVNGRMPVKVQCPNCGSDATTDANQIISRMMPAPSRSAAEAPAPRMVHAPSAIPAVMSATQAATVAAPSLRIAPAPSTAYAPAQDSSARSLLERKIFFVKERVAIIKLTDTYDILDPATGQQIGIAKEEPPAWAKWLRVLVKKHLMPTAVNIYESENLPPLVTIRRGFTVIRSKLHVTGADGRKLGYFRSKLLSLGGGFFVFDTQEQQIAEVKGDWKGWNFRFLNKSGRELGTVTKKWAGLGKELFTSADNYVISLTDEANAGPENVALLLAAGICIDVVFKERE